MIGSWIDWVILGVIVWSAAIGFQGGLVESVRGLLTLVLSVSGTIALTHPIVGWFSTGLSLPELWLEPIVFVVVLAIVGSLVAVAAAIVIGPFESLLRVWPGSRATGVLVSSLRGAALCGFVLMPIVTPPAFLQEIGPEGLSSVELAVQQSNFAPKILGGISVYDSRIQSLINQAVDAIVRSPGRPWTSPDVGDGSADCPVAPPVEQLSFSPSSPAMSGTTVRISAKASWNQCFRAMRVKVDGNVLYELGTPEYSFDWNTSNYSDGNHAVRVEVAIQGDDDWQYPSSREVTYQLR